MLVLPTYNERENLSALIGAIRVLPSPPQIIIVDDNSPDGTGEVADGLAKESADMEVIHRPGKLGLGTAYTAGFRRALDAGADLILTMDADFSHNPQYIPDLVAATRDFDLVIGSRYVVGGGIEGWGPSRAALSWGANALAHALIGLKARDCTAGFRCYRRAVLEQVEPAGIRANGYSYLIEILYRCQRLGLSIGEVPIIFADRRLGRSKISREEIAKAALTMGRLALRRAK